MHQNERHRKIVQYINFHQGYLTEEIFKGVCSHMARSTFFKDLEQLIEDKQIRVELVNKRDRRLYPYTDLLVSVSNDLDRFERTICELIKKGQDYLEVLAKKGDSNDLLESKKRIVLRISLLVFFDTIIMYNYFALFVWPKSVSEHKVLDRLYLLAFTKFNKVRGRLVEKYQDWLPDQIDDSVFLLPHSSLLEWMNSPTSERDGLNRLNNYFKEMGMYEEFIMAKKYLHELDCRILEEWTPLEYDWEPVHLH